MKAHIVGGGFGGLAAAVLLIRNADMSGPDITIYEADEKLGGGFFLAGDAKSGYNLPGSIFDKEFRCALDLLGQIPTQADSNINVAEQFLTFNKEHPFVDQTHIVDRNLRRIHDQRYGLSLSDGLRLAKLSLTREASLDGQRIKDWLFPKVLRNGILVTLVDADGFAATALHHRVPAIPEPLRLFVSRPVDHGTCSAVSIQPA
jgi:oleate hydratase